MPSPATPALPRLLVRRGAGGPESLPAHVARLGALPIIPAGDPLIDSIEMAGLRGRGGAGFPAATKFRAVAAGKRRPVVVANGAEGEPASAKDAALMSTVPHLVLDGAVAAAEALRANRVIVRVADPVALAALRRAVAERTAYRLDRMPVEVVGAPDRFLAGEETAAVRHLGGGPAVPAGPVPRPFERGVDGRPTLVQNVETLAHLALICRFGPEWFRQLGTPDDPGSTLVTVLGGVESPGVNEVALGTSVREVIARAGGATGPVAAILAGGYHGGWVSSDALATPLTHAGLRAAGGALGAGVLAVLPVGACGLRETARVARYLADESARQCGPCRNGLPSIAGELERLARGEPGSADTVARWAGLVTGRGACRHPDGTARFVLSALRVFADDIARHADGDVCRPNPPVLPLPSRRVAA